MAMIQDLVSNFQSNVQSVLSQIQGQRMSIIGQRSGIISKLGKKTDGKKAGIFGFGVLPFDQVFFKKKEETPGAPPSAPEEGSAPTSETHISETDSIGGVSSNHRARTAE